MKLTTLLPLLFTGALAFPTEDTTSNQTLTTRGEGLVSDAEISIIFYEKPDCRGNYKNFNNIKYNKNNQLVSGVLGNLYGGRSYYLDRALNPKERLDFSTPGHAKGITHNCAKYYKSAPLEQGKGCQPLGITVSCFNLWQKPVVEGVA